MSNFGDGKSSLEFNPQHIYTDSGLYTIRLVAINDFGCRDTAYEIIEVPSGWICFIPSAFSPNDDNTNEIFSPKGIGVRDYELEIYDRWGEVIYRGVNEGCDGLAKGDLPAKEDVYVYRINIVDNSGNSHLRKGRVSLIR